MRTATVWIVALAFLPSFTEASMARQARYLMGTVCEVAVAAEHEADAERAFAEAARVEAMLSTWIAESELSRLNRGQLDAPSAELSQVLATASEWSVRTNRAFDPRVRKLLEAWQTRDQGAVPDPAAIASAMAMPQWEEGAFGKGYALDRMLPLLRGRSALIDFGGQVAVRGRWPVAIADPADRSRPVLELTIADASLSTSSGSEKTFQADGRTFSHILDPRTGQALPPRGSVSVIATSAMEADILSTALYVMGPEEGLRWAGEHGVAAIFIESTNRIRTSPAVRERAHSLELLDRNFTLKD
jgi:thiamine biosynthesis lipoprotein